MRWLIAGLVLAMTAAAARAQVTPQSAAGTIGQSASRQTEEKSTQPKANDKAYNAALKNLPNKQYDPWRGVR
jgi:hypothetical protein